MNEKNTAESSKIFHLSLALVQKERAVFFCVLCSLSPECQEVRVKAKENRGPQKSKGSVLNAPK